MFGVSQLELADKAVRAPTRPPGYLGGYGKRLRACLKMTVQMDQQV